jgi:hypothetical protein
MKKLSSLLILTAAAICAHAQSSYKITFIQLLNDAQEKFSNSISTEIDKGANANPDAKYYNTSIGFGGGEESILFAAKYDKIIYTCDFDYSDTDQLLKAGKVLEDVLQVVNLYVKAGRYSGRDYEDNKGNTITELKTIDGQMALKIITYPENSGSAIWIYAVRPFKDPKENIESILNAAKTGFKSLKGDLIVGREAGEEINVKYYYCKSSLNAAEEYLVFRPLKNKMFFLAIFEYGTPHERERAAVMLSKAQEICDKMVTEGKLTKESGAWENEPGNSKIEYKTKEGKDFLYISTYKDDYGMSFVVHSQIMGNN